MASSHLSTKSIIAIVIGNALEWYDFTVYSCMMIVIGHLFFPAQNHIYSLLATTATFGVAFCMRPIGGILLGIYADKFGRGRAINLIITCMTIAVALIAFVPTYEQIGVAAPILMVIARLLQGFSAGGEFSISTSLLIELSPPQERGFYGSWQMVGQMSALLIGTAISLGLTYGLTESQIESWGWRLPFLAGLIIAPVGIYIRRNLTQAHADAAFMRANISIEELSQKLKLHGKQLLQAMGIVIGATLAGYTSLNYMPTYAVEYLHLPMQASFIGLTIGLLIMVCMLPVIGKLSDRIGRKVILLGTTFIYLVSIYPLFTWLLVTPSSIKLIFFQVICCLLLTPYYGVFIPLITDLFPREIRSTSLAISYNLAVMTFGGFAPFIVTWLIAHTASIMAITYYLLFGMSISFISAIFYREKRIVNEHTQLAVTPSRI